MSKNIQETEQLISQTIEETINVLTEAYIRKNKLLIKALGVLRLTKNYGLVREIEKEINPKQ